MLAAALVALPAVPAWAHAAFVSSSPGDGENHDQAPPSVSVAFTEAVEAPVGAIRVLDASGARVDEGDSGPGDTPDQVRASLTPGLGDGTYLVAWNVVSADGHPISGAFLFTVGDGGQAVDESALVVLLGDDQARPYAVAGTVMRWVTYAGALTAAGAAAFALVLRSTDRTWSRIRPLVRGAAGLAVVGSLAQIPLLAAESTGLGTAGLMLGPALAGVLAGPAGWSTGLRLGGLALLWTATARSTSPWWAWVGFAGVVAAEMASGHTLTTEPRLVVMAADGLHVAAAAAWLGGLAALSVILAGGERDTTHSARLVGGFSQMALWSVLALIAGGLALSWSQVRGPQALISTPYGWALMAKLGLAATVIAVGAYNRRVLVPAVTGGPSGDTVARTRLGRTVRWEVAGLALVLVVTSVLVVTRPAAEAAGAIGPFSANVAFGDGLLNLVVDPNRAGDNQVHLYVLSAAGLPTDATGQASLEMRLPGEDVGPIVREPQVAGPGHWSHSGPELSMAGTWEVTFRLTSGFEERAATAVVTVPS